MSSAAGIGIGVAIGLVLGIIVSVATDIPLAPEGGALLGGLAGWAYQRRVA